jgi:hypothetical protein
MPSVADDEFRPPVLRTGALPGPLDDWEFLSVTDDGQPLGGDPQAQKISVCGLSPFLPKSEIVCLGPLLVGVSLGLHLDSGIALQPTGILPQNFPRRVGQQVRSEGKQIFFRPPPSIFPDFISQAGESFLLKDLLP